ncbi:hypothetical protein EQU24_19070 [Methylotuvimicrobium buryatense]|uniref:Uncharacterized protein n=1 Tax=Methylotuvimicrobium buryatense TaxID=95641 RepID=A0A4P9URI8_METBY|nr:hypothetical protein EQU24_19070 [Methylotuvimicrobium buryatense]
MAKKTKPREKAVCTQCVPFDEYPDPVRSKGFSKPTLRYSLYTQKMANFMKVWGVASEDVGSRDRCRQAPMEGFTAVLDRHIPYLLFLDGFSIKRE